MKLASYIHPEFHKKSFGLVDKHGIIDIGRHVSPKYADLKYSARCGNAIRTHALFHISHRLQY